MPIKVKVYTATDGTLFTDRASYRRHEMETQYTFRNKTKGDKCVKRVGQLGGQPFDIIDCEECELILLDHSDQVQIDNCKNCKIFIGASSGSIFLRNCQGCILTLACKQFRTRDCTNFTIYLYCKTEPVIEKSVNLR